MTFAIAVATANVGSGCSSQDDSSTQAALAEGCSINSDCNSRRSAAATAAAEYTSTLFRTSLAFG